MIPGAVEPDLWNEHLSRYRFASRFARGKDVLDLGCGTGYGAELLAESAHHVTGLDCSAEAVSFAAAHFPRPDFIVGSATELSLDSSAFGLVTAFELIEHLADWPKLLSEAARVLAPDGIFLVSTPNRVAYAEARGENGPNPFHLHEFEREEFEQALQDHFPFVEVLGQNHQAAVTFASRAAAGTDGYLPALSPSSESQYFLAVCARHPVAISSFVFVPVAANVLRERESHIKALQSEVRDSQGQLKSLLADHRALNAELESHNAWALGLESELNQARTQLRNRDTELASATASLEYVRADLAGTQSALATTRADLGDTRTALESAQTSLESTQADLAGTRAALESAHAARAHSESARESLEARLQAAQRHNDSLVAHIETIRNSLWIRFGRSLQVGPYSSRRLRISNVKASLREQSKSFWQFAKSTTAYLASLPILLMAAIVLLAVDVTFSLFGRRRLRPSASVRHESASIIIPSWNGRHLLARSLEPLLAAVELDARNEIIVVDNASSDGSADFLRENFPQVRVHQLPRNAGFAGGANAGVEIARNEVVVLLNNDMHVRPGFLGALLKHFADPLLFAVTSQIFFVDPDRRREETGLTESWWENGTLRVSHRADPDLNVAYPCAYPGGGSSAFARSKFLELGGFDALFHPFYYEDTDLGHLAWKRGWKVLYEPASVVFHEHRGTIGKKFSPSFIGNVIRKNAILYCWKNIHDWRLLLSHVRVTLFNNLRHLPSHDVADSSPVADTLHASRQLPEVVRSRWRALSLKAFSDREAFLRPKGGYFRDRFLASTASVPDRLNVLFAAPYPIEPPVHGGAVFMKETLTTLASIADVHVLSFIDTPAQLDANGKLATFCKTVQLLVRPHFPLKAFWTLKPIAVREFAVRDFDWLLQRSIYLLNIDVLQLEYTMLGQYGRDFRHIPSILFEHDISLQSMGRRLKRTGFNFELFTEYVRTRIYELGLLKKMTRIQVCSAENANYLLDLVPSLRGRVDSHVRAAIDVSRYEFVSSHRLPDTILFVGSFRHSPNLDALRWFTEEVFPTIVRSRPSVRLHIVGSDPPISSTIWNDNPHVHLHGTVPDIQEPFHRFAVFVCPVLSGSGVRVKLLEAFACGIPAVSTRVGAEGLAKTSGELCELADDPETFAASVLRLLLDTDYSRAIATRARQMVEQQRDSREATRRLESVYRTEVQTKRSGLLSKVSRYKVTPVPATHSLAQEKAAK